MLVSSPGKNTSIAFALLGLIALASVARLPGLEKVPPLLNQDEASRGYDAWAMIETGADRHGVSWPFFLESFGPGDYTAALSSYITLPFVAVLGPTPMAMRLPDAILGVLTVAVMYVWLRRRFGETLAIVAAAVLAMDPWHIALTRTAHESGFAPFFMVLALMALDRAGFLPETRRAGANSLPSSNIRPTSEKRRSRYACLWAFVAGLMLAAHAWVYPATRLFTPLWGVALLCICGRHWWGLARKREARSALFSAAIGLLVGAMPIILTAIWHPEQLAARASATVLLYQDLPTATISRQCMANLATNLDPRYWFLQCDEMSGASIPNVGQHLLIWAPFFLIGLCKSLAGLRRHGWDRLLVAWLLLYSVPAAICNDWNPHPMRTVGGMLLFPLITAGGFQLAAQFVRNRFPHWQRHARAALAILLMANLCHFANAYYRRFPALAEPAYQTALVEALRFASERTDDVDFVLVTNRAVQPYIYALLLEPVTPKDLQTARPIICDGPCGFHQVIAIGKYLFTPQDPVAFPEAAAAFRDALARLPAGANGFVVERAGLFKEGELVQTFPAGDGRNEAENYEVRRWRLGS